MSTQNLDNIAEISQLLFNIPDMFRNCGTWQYCLNIWCYGGYLIGTEIREISQEAGKISFSNFNSSILLLLDTIKWIFKNSIISLFKVALS